MASALLPTTTHVVAPHLLTNGGLSSVPVAAVQTMEDVVRASVTEPRFTMTLLLVFGGVALLLAAMGVYAVISYSNEKNQALGCRV